MISMPRSLLFIPAALVSYLVQMVPFVGDIFSFTGGFMLPCLLLNIAALGLFVQFCNGTARMIWLTVPIAWVAGCMIVAAKDRQEATVVEREIAAMRTPALNIPYSVEPSVPQPLAADLVARFRIKSVIAPPSPYSGSEYGTTARYSDASNETCNRMGFDNSSGRPIRAQMVSVVEDGSLNNDDLQKRCVIRTTINEIDEDSNPVRVDKTEEIKAIHDRDVNITTYHASYNGRESSISTAYIRNAGWFAIFALGCRQGRNHSDYICGSELIKPKGTHVQENGLGSAGVVGKLLGLKPRVAKAA